MRKTHWLKLRTDHIGCAIPFALQWSFSKPPIDDIGPGFLFFPFFFGFPTSLLFRMKRAHDRIFFPAKHSARHVLSSSWPNRPYLNLKRSIGGRYELKLSSYQRLSILQIPISSQSIRIEHIRFQYEMYICLGIGRFLKPWIKSTS